MVAVDVMMPAVGAGDDEAAENTTVLGVEKFARFKKLKNSARNCMRSLSEIGVSLARERSRVARPGPVRMSRPALP